MASLPHTPPSNTPNTPAAQSSPALVESRREASREAGARFASRESTPPPSAVQHSFHPARDIVSGSGFHDRPQQGGVTSKGQTLEETEQSPPGAFPSAGNEEEKEADAGEEVKHAVTAIHDYAKSHLPASLGTYIDTDKEDDQPHDEEHGSPSATSGEPSAATPEDCDPSAKDQSGPNNETGDFHNTNAFRDPDNQTHSSHTVENSTSEVSTSKRASPETARPSAYVDEPSASACLYADTFVPPIRTYDVVRDAMTGERQDISSGFGRSIQKASLAEPIVTVRAVPFTAEPPLVVYPKTSAPIFVSTYQEKVEIEQSEESVSTPSEHARPIRSAFYEDQQGEASVLDGTSSGTPVLSEQEQSGSRDVSDEGEDVYESPQECDTEAKAKPKGFLSKLNKWIRGKSSGKNGKRSKEGPPANPPESPFAEGVEPDNTTTVPETHGRNVTPPSEVSSSTSRKEFGARPVRIAEAPVASKGGHLKSASFRRRAHLDIIPKHVPEHFDETIGPLPQHVEMRGKRELPTKEKPGGSRVGVGSLPGRRDEAGVARLPDERNITIGASLGRANDEQVSQAIESDVDAGTSLFSEVSQRSSSSDKGSLSSSSSSSEGGVEQDKEPQIGFLSDLLWEAEEVLRDLGDVALHYVPGFGYPSEEDSDVCTPTTPESREDQSVSPSPVSASTPTREPPSSPVIGFREESSEGTGVATYATQPPMPDPRPLEEQLFAPTAQPYQFVTPMNPSPHPSRSSSADVVHPDVFVAGLPSTQERISGRQEEVASPLMREYVKSPKLEDPEMEVGMEGSLPGYPTEGGLRALIGERMYDDEMRAAGAAEPVEETAFPLPSEQRQEEFTTSEAVAEENEPAFELGSEKSQVVPSESDRSYHALSPPPIYVSSSHENVETKGFDVKGLGPPVPEGRQEKKRILADQPRKPHN
ncbi:hypothetical protein AGABI1DRAFT_132569 [Agaricus bisporus var. burnettii JB137-S8]|uniref:Uncharacterized protein n=1 Tax=Agaricus bisporus var. burnettii (strain JB137-S8 / ATCC MYA-4627 / FGSC 10392) TaxID=597362 RepID=K5XKV9_AGABU|nr:uncharacterized protein AGABI1DRAFT_132569 [Agaricus bisporus var. burnettii JB137-S8]EKM75120.1 hypothetical protein AGABI1DRAFT_132569 [Agaricus bisporus var. burnettii JB137-S8]